MSIGIGLFGVAGPKLRAHLGSVPRSLRSRARRVGNYSALPKGRKRTEEGARDLAHTAPQPGRKTARGGRSPGRCREADRGDGACTSLRSIPFRDNFSEFRHVEGKKLWDATWLVIAYCSWASCLIDSLTKVVRMEPKTRR